MERDNLGNKETAILSRVPPHGCTSRWRGVSNHKGQLNATKASPYSPMNSTTKVRIHPSTKDSFKGGEGPVQIREAHTHN